MALVDYGSSSDEEDEEKVVEDEEDEQYKPSHPVPTLPTPPTTQAAAFTSPRTSLNDVPSSSNVSVERLPDASMLLGSSFPFSDAVSAGGHSSIIAAARAENFSRKRESNGLAVSSKQNKYPRTAPSQRNVHNAAGGLLVPPQVSGRSNVVTEDIGKLFVNRRGGNLPD